MEGLRKTKKIMSGPSHVGSRGRLIIQGPLNPIFFELFRPRIGLENDDVGRVPKLWIIFGEILPRVETSICQRQSLRLLWVGTSGSCPNGPPTRPALVRNSRCCGTCSNLVPMEHTVTSVAVLKNPAVSQNRPNNQKDVVCNTKIPCVELLELLLAGYD